MKKEELNNIILRINKETPNFQHIIRKLPYKSADHKKAIEVHSFELLKTEISKLRSIKKFRKYSEEILKSIEKKDAFELTKHLNKLKPNLVNYFKNIRPDKEKTGEILQLKPNFYGIGIDLKAWWKKVTHT